MTNVAIFVAPGQEAAGDILLSEVYGEPQSGSFTQRLSNTGQEPTTLVGAYARGLDDDQFRIISGQETIQWHEGTWPDALFELGMSVIVEEEG